MVCFQGFTDKDVYVCESRYSSRLRGFKKIKVKIISGEIKCIEYLNLHAFVALDVKVYIVSLVGLKYLG